MAEKNLVNETLLQIQNLEEVINENAKEILASTMKEEISELVKESMKEEAETDEVKEAEEDELLSIGDEESEEEDEESEEEEDEESEDDFEMEDEMDMMDTDDSEVVDFSGLPDTDETAEMIAKVFKNMKDTDEITIVQDGDYLHLTDEPADTEYLIQTEGEEDFEYELEESKDETEDSEDEFAEGLEMEESSSFQPEEDEVIYELELGDDPFDTKEEYEFELEDSDDDSEEWSKFGDKLSDISSRLDKQFPGEDEVYMDYEEESDEDENNESYNPMMEAKMAKKMETKEGMKPKVGKGAKTGSAKKFSYKKSSGGFKETMKKANPTKGTGKPKFEFKEGEMMDMPSKMPKLSKEEAKEAARTYGTGWRKGALPKGARAGQEAARKATNESAMVELEMLRAKNEEYRKALNLFRDKLNEVAIFNSNLAYATRLFTEHSTSKQEKINILRRFDSAETLKESKALYKTIKDELSSTTKSTPITESIERVIDREPQSGSAVNLIESKTYENPQFLRMKDIMSKIAK